MSKNSHDDYYDLIADIEQRKHQQIDDDSGNKSSASDKLLQFLDWLRTFLFIILIGLFISLFVIQRNTISGPSMEPTLQNNDQIFVEKISKYFKIERGDIVTIDEAEDDHPHNLLIKRVIGLPGEKIEINDGVVYINDQELIEEYLPNGVVTTANPEMEHTSEILGEDEYFVLGDNRSVSKDSRRLGPVHKDQIIGKLLVRFYPFDSIGKPD
ncbi:MAG: signal peptidase I [Saccharofermentanales bacterium]|nr:signal peptidase I [Bacillota bacterium]